MSSDTSLDYFIGGMPRTRTAWLANFLSYRDHVCLHEALSRCDHVHDLQLLTRGKGRMGDADPALGMYAKDVLKLFPDARYVVITRPEHECVASMIKSMGDERIEANFDVLRDAIDESFLGCTFLHHELPHDQCLFLDWRALDRAEIIRRIWEFCLPGEEFPEQRYAMLKDMRITIIFKKAIQYAGLLAHRAA